MCCCFLQANQFAFIHVLFGLLLELTLKKTQRMLSLIKRILVHVPLKEMYAKAFIPYTDVINVVQTQGEVLRDV